MKRFPLLAEQITRCFKRCRFQRVVQGTVLGLTLFITGCGCDSTNPPELPASVDVKPVAWLQLENTTLAVEEVVTGLDQPRDLKLAPNGTLWISEVTGQLVVADPTTGEKRTVFSVPDLFHERARGLLSAALHPAFDSEPYVYLHYSYAREELGSRLVRYRYDGEGLTEPFVIADPLPGGSGHSGSKLMIGPDQKLWLATGDASIGEKAQDWDELNGKILRFNLDGSLPLDNPYPDNPAWSVGHRNIQGLTHDGDRVFASEHGPATDDEVNRIVRGGNYGWPDVQGYCDSELEQIYCSEHDIVEPIHAFTPVVAPAGIAWYDHPAIPEWRSSLLLASLRIQTLRVLSLAPGSDQVTSVSIFLQQQIGRIRDVITSDSGEVFLLTSNTDWYREARSDIHDPALITDGDKVIRLRSLGEVDPTERPEGTPLWMEDRIPLYLGDSEIVDSASARERLYQTHCAACHGIQGEGMAGVAPSLVQSDRVSSEPGPFLENLLFGMEESSGAYEMAMPGFAHLTSEELVAIANYVRNELAGLDQVLGAEEVERHLSSGSDN